MSLTEMVDDVVNFVPNKGVEFAFRIFKEPEGTLLNCLSPIGYTIGLAAEAAIIGCTAGYVAGKFTDIPYIGLGAAVLTLVASLAVKGITMYKD